MLLSSNTIASDTIDSVHVVLYYMPLRQCICPLLLSLSSPFVAPLSAIDNVAALRPRASGAAFSFSVSHSDMTQGDGARRWSKGGGSERRGVGGRGIDRCGNVASDRVFLKMSNLNEHFTPKWKFVS